MKIYLVGDNAFYEISEGYMLYIGTKAEVESASEIRLCEMVIEAMVWSDYRKIETGKGWILQ